MGSSEGEGPSNISDITVHLIHEWTEISALASKQENGRKKLLSAGKMTNCVIAVARNTIQGLL